MDRSTCEKMQMNKHKGELIPLVVCYCENCELGYDSMDTNNTKECPECRSNEVCNSKDETDYTYTVNGMKHLVEWMPHSNRYEAGGCVSETLSEVLASLDNRPKSLAEVIFS